MALIKLYESAAAVALYGTEGWAINAMRYGFYTRRHDCVVLNNGAFAGLYKIYRDGTAIRVCTGTNVFEHYDSERDLFFTQITGGVNCYNDPIGMRYDNAVPAPYTYNGIISGPGKSGFLWRGLLYAAGGITVSKYTMAGTLDSSFTISGSITPYSADAMAITPDGLLVALDFDNGTYGVARFYDLTTATALHTSVFDKAHQAWVDTEHRNIWSINKTNGKLQTWSFDVAPSNFTAITMGANRSRYRQDDLSVTLRGSVNEPCPNWPVKWTLATAEGHLRDEVTFTNTSGVTENLYCGPGADDFVGATQTITVETGY